MERILTEQEIVRRGKINKLIEAGIKPFGSRYLRTDSAETIRAYALEKDKEELEANPHTVAIAGRIMFIRKMGKASFFSIKDKTGLIQIYISINDIGEESYNLFKSADIVDIV